MFTPKIIKSLVQIYKKNPYKILLIIAFLSSFLALFMAYISQYFFGLEPCILCYYQRKPFFVVLAISLLALLLKSKRYLKIATILCALTFFINAGIAFYHSGVEFKWFDGPKTCATQNLENISDLEQLRQTILSTKAIRCDEPQFYFLKLTMANWNFLYSAGLFLLMLAILVQEKLSKKYETK
ncbi:MAG: disulfide bond formation protein B [Proteobacteria bacterium]|nr:disulfide bond formation protein B [Pseudomonadota bacterium]NCA28833.1 disulfide bond formation protein B [Pseudomonadota bacterium]